MFSFWQSSCQSYNFERDLKINGSQLDHLSQEKSSQLQSPLSQSLSFTQKNKNVESKTDDLGIEKKLNENDNNGNVNAMGINSIHSVDSCKSDTKFGINSSKNNNMNMHNDAGRKKVHSNRSKSKNKSKSKDASKHTEFRNRMSQNRSSSAF